MTVTLPTPEGNTGTNDWSDVYSNDKALKEAVETLQAEVGGVTWYSPKVIATEQSRTSTEFGFLTTEDKIENVVLPENGLLVVGYQATWKCSSAGAGRAALFVGANQVKYALDNQTEPTVQEATLGASAGTSFKPLGTATSGLISGAEAAAYTGDVTTGQLIGAFQSAGPAVGGLALLFAAPATYTVGVKYRSTGGSVTVKGRKLWVATFG